MALTLVRLIEGGQRRPLADLQGDILYIGREPREGLTIDSTAISREHGVLLKLAGQWYFKDLASTNGSWLNDKPLNAGQPYLIRPNDNLQLADVLLFFSGGDESLFTAPSVLAFLRGDLIGEFFVRDIGKVVSVGGVKSDLKLDVDFQDLPVVVIEKRTGFLCAYPVASNNKAIINAQPLSQIVQLKDRDVIMVESYVLIVNIADPKMLEPIAPENPLKIEELRETFADWDTQEKRIERTIFGHIPSQEAETSQVDDEHAIVADMRPSSRFIQPAEDVGTRASALEEKFVFIIGFILVFVILVLSALWFLR